MLKKGKLYIIFGLLTLLLFMYLEYNKPKQLNWFPSYVNYHKIPYGMFVNQSIMEDWFSDHIRPVEISPFEFLKSNSDFKGTYFFVNETITFRDDELNELLNWTSKGNTLYIASSDFEDQILDTLGLEQEYLFTRQSVNPEFHLELVNPLLRSEETYKFDKHYSATYFSVIDTLKTTILGTIKNNNNISSEVNVISVPFGSGSIILNSFPEAYTNYFILKDNNQKYTSGLLSYIDSRSTIYIDNYYKSGKTFYSSPMHIFLSTKELKWAYYIILFGAFLYVIFEGKRKQRAIPIIKPVKNQTLEFTRTIANMYFEKGKQKEISRHKINYFMDFLRRKMYMNTNTINTEFYKNLAGKSHHTEEEIRSLFKLIKQIQNKQYVTDQDLIKLDQEIENFKQRSHGKQ